MFRKKKKGSNAVIDPNDIPLDLDDLAKGDDLSVRNRKKVKKPKVSSGDKGMFDFLHVFKHLNEKVEGMGYSYSIGSFLKSYIMYAILIIVLGYFHKLELVYIILLIIIFFCFFPFTVYYQFKYLYEQKKFQELCVYLKQMKINFRSNKKILVALEETLINFKKEDRIYPYMVSAINAIRSGESYRDALDIIEVPFKNSYITKLHAYMILGELEGGTSVFQALDNIDYESWRTDTYIFQTQKYKYQGQNAYYTLLGLGVSLACVYIFGIIDMGEGAGFVFGYSSYQIYTFLYILADLIGFISVKSLIKGKWVREDE